MDLNSLPAEMISAILEHLQPNDLTKLARVSKKYCEFAQAALWRSIELHRQDAHHDCVRLSVSDTIRRTYLDDHLRDPWSYCDFNENDQDFDRRHAKFATVVRKVYRTAGKSQAWARLGPMVQHLCLTVTNKSPPQIWDMILSLQNLSTIEVIGENSLVHQLPPQPTSLREPAAKSICSVRLRGYIPALFVAAVCKASASSISSLDIGVLEQPKVFVGDADEEELGQELGYPLYVAPRGVLWFSDERTPRLSSLSHLMLCKRGSFDGPPDMSEEEDLEKREDEEHELAELKHWASLLKSGRSTLVEIVLDQRPVYLSYLLNHGFELSSHDRTSFCPGLHSFDSAFYHHVLKTTFDDGGAWPELKKLTFRGINLLELEDEAGESMDAWANRALPGVKVQSTDSNYMFFNTRSGTIMNNGSADGLMPHLDPEPDSGRDSFDMEDHLLSILRSL
ncbi:hypothetical protein BKA63DRAFT_601299 [Paraphoma chrysanthemicola]|nr:hypothetical protein BKA63DRAFT_601299 [Paraphoma chrysanthemicola]